VRNLSYALVLLIHFPALNAAFKSAGFSGHPLVSFFLTTSFIVMGYIVGATPGIDENKAIKRGVQIGLVFFLSIANIAYAWGYFFNEELTVVALQAKSFKELYRFFAYAQIAPISAILSLWSLEDMDEKMKAIPPEDKKARRKLAAHYAPMVLFSVINYLFPWIL
jgi:hypothetical protein